MHDMIQKDKKPNEEKARIIYVDEATLNRIDVFPFLLITPEIAKRIGAKAGRTVTIRHDTEEIQRTIYSTHVMKQKKAKAYGWTGHSNAFVCFVPNEL